MKLFSYLINFSFLVLFNALVQGHPLQELVKTEEGRVLGVKKTIFEFKGIPYAAAPSGRLRWKPPVRAVSWKGIRDAKNFGDSCPQVFDKNSVEDCLSLNVWSSAKDDTDKLPVMVWIHGGGFSGESASMPLFEGECLAKKGVVVVTFNYRLGVFGFLGHPLLSRESPQGVSGNYGLFDQVAALEWVKRNIAAFGGDPNRVTLFGESAGGESVAHLMVSPSAKGLFHRAIIQSGFGIPSHRSLKTLEGEGERIFTQCGCEKSRDKLSCMRRKTTKEILEALYPDPKSSLIQFAPVTDGFLIPESPGQIFAKGSQRDIPLLAGMNSGEVAKNPELENVKSIGDYKSFLSKKFPKEWKKVWDYFPASSDAEVRNSLQRFLTTDLMVRGVRNMLLSMKGKSPSFLYFFSRVPPFAKVIGAFHELEVRYVFGTLMGSPDFETVDFQLSDNIQKYWVNFATAGNPNSVGLPTWFPFKETSEKYLGFGDVIKRGHHLYAKECNLLDRIER